MQNKIEHLPISPVYFDEATALKLAQVFSQQDDLRELLRLLYVQMRAVCQTAGLHFVSATQPVEFSFGQTAAHQAQYNLQFRDENIGVLTRYFVHPQQDQDIQTGEDLIGLALLAIRNAAKSHSKRPEPDMTEQAQLSTDEKLALAEIASPDKAQPKADTLVLVSLDNFAGIIERDGEEWADILMTGMHQQVEHGLRSADSVYHIGDDLIAVLLPRTTQQQAIQVAHKIRTLVASLHLRGDSTATQLTASMGISSSLHADTADDVMANARLALAHAQATGRNQLKVYDPHEERNAG